MRRSLSLNLAIWTIVLLSGLLLTCSEDGPTDSGGDGSGGSSGDISVTPGSTTPGALSALAIEGLPARNDSLFGRVWAGDDDRSGVAFIERSETGDSLLIPFHPVTPLSGGEIKVVITDDATVESDTLRLTVGPLPEADGAYSRLVAAMQGVLDEMLRLHGTTREALRTTPADSFPVAQLPLMAMYNGLDNPDNPNSLAAFAAGDIPMFDGEDVDRELLDRIIGASGLEEYFTQYRSLLESMDVPTMGATPPIRLGVTSGSLGSACIPAPTFGISTCSDLALRMQQWNEMNNWNHSSRKKLLNDAEATVLTAVGMIPFFGPHATLLGSISWMDQQLQDGTLALYPSEFVENRTRFDASPTSFPEDFTDPGEWSRFRVSAASKGWTLDKAAMEALLNSLSVKGASDAVNKGLTQKQLLDFKGSLEGAVTGAGLGTIMNEYADEAGVIQVCPYVWADIDCSGLPYSKGRPFASLLEVNSDDQTYKPKKIDEGGLVVETTGEFPPDQTGYTEAIKLEKIQVFINPFQADADTNEIINFSTRVEHAENTDVKWNISGPGKFIDKGPSSAIVQAPDTPWDEPFYVIARSIANTGLREGKVDSDPREDSAEVRYEGNQVLVSPAEECLDPGEQKDFEVSIIGGQVDSVRWETDPPNTGSFEGNTYTAPNSPVGQVTLIATVNGKDKGYATVLVGTCACNWSATLSGAVNTFLEGTGAWLDATGAGLTFSYTPNGEVFVMCFPYVTGTGIYDSVAVNLTYQGQTYISSEQDEHTPPSLEVTEYVPEDYIKGTLSGDLIVPLSPGQHIVLSMSFRAQIFNPPEPLCGEQ